MAYVCEMCNFATPIKTHYNRHCGTEKHKLKTAPDLQKQLANIKIEEMELKTEMKLKESKEKQEAKQIELEMKQNLKRIELEKKQELKKKEHDLKEKIKEDLLKTEEKMIARKTLEKALPVITFMEQVIDRPKLEDYTDIFNGAATFEDIFMRDFLAEYDNSKSVVLEKGLTTGYYMNNAPCLWFFYLNDTTANGLTRILSLIPLYHKYLKEYAKENGCNVKQFNLSQEEKNRLEEWMREEMTFLVAI
jgi:hypothetical protein